MAGEDRLREYLKKATADLAEARRREAAADEPLAVVGMACRFPGAPSVDRYWDLLSNGRTGVVDDVPDGRFDLAALRETDGVYTTRGGYLDDIAGWDASFFGASPREALRMDPQQRLLMELTWESLEDAGLPPADLAGSRTAVMIGLSDTLQYGRIQQEREGLSMVHDPYGGQGASLSVAMRPDRVPLRPARSHHDGGHRVFLLAGRRAPRRGGTAPRRVHDGRGRRRIPDDPPRHVRQRLCHGHAVAGRPVPDLRRPCRRLRPR